MKQFTASPQAHHFLPLQTAWGQHGEQFWETLDPVPPQRKLISLRRNGINIRVKHYIPRWFCNNFSYLQPKLMMTSLAAARNVQHPNTWTRKQFLWVSACELDPFGCYYWFSLASAMCDNITQSVEKLFWGDHTLWNCRDLVSWSRLRTSGFGEVQSARIQRCLTLSA
jgi:hypothetical protein